MRGFTLIEVLVTIAISAILIGSGFFISIDAYRSTSFERQFHLLIQVLEKARSEALNNIDEESHGVAVEKSQFIIFSGDLYDPVKLDNEKIARDKKIEISGPSQVVFHNLDGAPSATCTFIITDGSRSKTLSVEEEGRINW